MRKLPPASVSGDAFDIIHRRTVVCVYFATSILMFAHHPNPLRDSCYAVLVMRFLLCGFCYAVFDMRFLTCGS